MSQLYRVLYCSRNTIGCADVASHLHAILAASRANNSRDGVTGALLFDAGCFAQVLEGPVEAVEAAFERIQCDDRHSEVTVLEAGPIAERDFPNWSMAFAGVDAATSPLATAVLAEAFTDGKTGGEKAGGEVLGLLRSLVHRGAEWLAPAAA